eukprot:5777124-Pyramimonas_sp.AAC.1
MAWGMGAPMSCRAAEKELCPEQSDGSRRGPKSARTPSLAAILEYEDNKSGVESNIQGKMMWEEEFYDHAKTAAGGKMSPKQAQAQWLDWSNKYENNPDDIIWDKDGPEPSPLQFWVKVGKFVNLTNKHEVGRRMEKTLVTNKKATQDDVAKMKKIARNGPDELEGMGVDGMMAKLLVKNTGSSGSSSAFAPGKMAIGTTKFGDIFVDSDNETPRKGKTDRGFKSDSDSSDSGSDDGDDDDGRDDDPKPEAKVAWFDRDRALNAAK